MQGAGAFALTVMVLCAPLGATAKTARAKKHISLTGVTVSPNGLHKAKSSPRGVILDRHLLLAERGKVKSLVWRRDSQALAYLQRTELGLLLVVLPRLGNHRPLTWRLPTNMQHLTRIFWISDSKIGVGTRQLPPRITFSWRSFVRAASRHYY